MRLALARPVAVRLVRLALARPVAVRLVGLALAGITVATATAASLRTFANLVVAV